MERISGNGGTIALQEGYDSFAKEVKANAHGGKVLLFTEEGRSGEDARAALAFEGLPIVKRDPNVSSGEMPEGIMAVVGVGGARAIEAAKSTRVGSRVPKILFPTDLSALCGWDDRTFLDLKSDVMMIGSEGNLVLFDRKILSGGGRERAGIGYLVASLVEEIDAVYEGLILSGENPAAPLRRIKERAEHLGDLREDGLAESLTEVAINGTNEPAVPLSESVHLLAMLSARKCGGHYADHLFASAYALIRLYATYLGDLPLEHCPPPDRAENAALLKRTCALSANEILKRGKTYADDYDKRAHITAEYREDFLECLSESVLPLSLLSRLYRRAPATEASKSPTATELLALLSLTGEAVSGYPLLKHIKMTGVLEPLLGCA